MRLSKNIVFDSLSVGTTLPIESVVSKKAGKARFFDAAHRAAELYVTRILPSRGGGMQYRGLRPAARKLYRQTEKPSKGGFFFCASFCAAPLDKPACAA
nr:hypothetical protein [uncultured Agathobaculum sp.]